MGGNSAAAGRARQARAGVASRVPPKSVTNMRPKQPSAAYAAFADALATATFVLLSSLFGEVAGLLSQHLGTPPLASLLAVIVAGVMLHTPLCNALGGALFNPSHNAAFIVAGVGGRPSTHLLRAAGQVAGGIAGSAAAVALVPETWQRGFTVLGDGLRPGVTLAQGVACEAGLAFCLNLVVLWSMGLSNKNAAFWAPLLCTMGFIAAGAELTGPSMNPAISFSWFVQFQGHPVFEHVLLFWAAPLAGGLLAGLVWSRVMARAGSGAAAAHSKAD